jgi:hypothetical protein
MRNYFKRISVFLLLLLISQILPNIGIPNYFQDYNVFAAGTATPTVTPTKAATSTPTATPTSTVTYTPTPINYVLSGLNEFTDSINTKDSIVVNGNEFFELSLNAGNYKLYVMQHPTQPNKLIANLICNGTIFTGENTYSDISATITQKSFKINGVDIAYTKYNSKYTSYNQYNYMYFTYESYDYSYTSDKPLVIDIPKRADNTILIEMMATAHAGRFSRDLTATYTKSFPLNYDPYVSVNYPVQNSIYSEQDSISLPSICVADKNNDTLTCRYYFDSESVAREEKVITSESALKTVTFSNALNLSSISQGSHRIRFEVCDGKSKITKSIFIKIDKSPPTLNKLNITSTDTSISVVGAAKDNIAGLDTNPYCFTVGGTQSSSWTSSNSYTTQTALAPNTQYAVKFDARDKKGHILSVQKSYYTKAQATSISANNITANTMIISFNDSNPSSTKYQVMVGDKYVNDTGALTTNPTWVTLTSKQVVITGLTTKTTYSIKAKVRNNALVETGFSNILSATTL